MKANIYKHEQKKLLVIVISAFLVVMLSGNQFVFKPSAQDEVNPNPPDHIVKLIFIHHSCGENLLNDDNGGLGLVLSSNHYFVSDTYYGWGPDGIGDRTDILDWPEWFVGSNSAQYMDAVFNESEQSTWYSRQVQDPGGENEIIMFKSCFPNSDMGGRPDDVPKSGNSLTVASAKQVYIDLLETFAQHPDKLFVVLTAPPMRDISRPESTRAFNTWLVEDWLDEAQYAYDNVAVWDFYNVLTAPDHHHRVVNGSVQYITDQGGNTLYYPDGDDDHPSQQGNLKAVEELVPMLNVFYNRWQNSAPVSGQPVALPETEENQTTTEGDEPQAAEQVPSTIAAAGLLDGFDEAGLIWECYADEAANTNIQCAIEAREDDATNQAYHIQFDVAAQSWATAVTFFDQPLNISDTSGLTLELNNPEANLINLIIYRGNDESRETYLFRLDSNAYTDWNPLALQWSDFKRAEWESGANESLTSGEISGFGFGFDGLDQEANEGQLWVDNITWSSADTQAVAPVTEALPSTEELAAEEEDAEESTSNGGNGFLLCPGSAALLFFVFTFGLLHVRTRLI